CFKSTTQKVRPSSILVNASPQCKTTETARTWNEMGPQGLQGPAGPSDGFHTAGSPVRPLPIGGGTVELARLTLPSGTYVISAIPQIGSDTPVGAGDTPFSFQCAVGPDTQSWFGGGLLGQADWVGANGLRVQHSIPLSGIATVDGSTPAILSC